MNSLGETDSGYVAARSALLDAASALGDARGSLTLIGAQAIYIHTGDAGLTAAPYTLDADLAVNPLTMPSKPKIHRAMADAGFALARRGDDYLIGSWVKEQVVSGTRVLVPVDLMTPSRLSEGGRRTAVVQGVRGHSVRRTVGIEACVVDRAVHQIAALEPSDPRTFDMYVAGPAGLLVAKATKLSERCQAVGAGRADRISPKDALDILRILRGVGMPDLVTGMAGLLKDELSAGVTEHALSEVGRLFSTRYAQGTQLAAQAAYPESTEAIEASCVALSQALIRSINA